MKRAKERMKCFGGGVEKVMLGASLRWGADVWMRRKDLGRNLSGKRKTKDLHQEKLRAFGHLQACWCGRGGSEMVVERCHGGPLGCVRTPRLL